MHAFHVCVRAKELMNIYTYYICKYTNYYRVALLSTVAPTCAYHVLPFGVAVLVILDTIWHDLSRLGCGSLQKALGRISKKYANAQHEIVF